MRCLNALYPSASTQKIIMQITLFFSGSITLLLVGFFLWYKQIQFNLTRKNEKDY
jgi:hypothetical protein